MRLLKLVIIFMFLFNAISYAQQVNTGKTIMSGSLQVTHTPLSLKDVPKELIEKLNYPYVRFYRTDVKNNTDRPIKIIWFDGYFSYEGRWYASNVRNKVLQTKDFLDWYSKDDILSDGWLRPGGTASCYVNWHWTETEQDINTKWAYIGIDSQSHDFFAEAVVPEIKPERIKAPTNR